MIQLNKFSSKRIKICYRRYLWPHSGVPEASLLGKLAQTVGLEGWPVVALVNFGRSKLAEDAVQDGLELVLAGRAFLVSRCPVGLIVNVDEPVPSAWYWRRSHQKASTTVSQASWMASGARKTDGRCWFGRLCIAWRAARPCRRSPGTIPLIWWGAWS